MGGRVIKILIKKYVSQIGFVCLVTNTSLLFLYLMPKIFPLPHITIYVSFNICAFVFTIIFTAVGVFALLFLRDVVIAILKPSHFLSTICLDEMSCLQINQTKYIKHICERNLINLNKLNFKHKNSTLK